MQHGEAHAMGMAYIWGRQDAGESARDTGYSIEFGAAYALRWDAYTGEACGSCVPVQTAYAEWHETKRLTYRSRKSPTGWREIVPMTEHGTTTVIDREAAEPPSKVYI